MTPDVPSSVGQGDQGDYSVGELAAVLGVTRQAVQARVKSGSIRASKVNGAWRIPAAVASALISAEHTKAVVSGRVTVLPLAPPDGLGALDELAEVVQRLESRVAKAEMEHAAQADRFDRALALLAETLESKQGEIEALQEDRRRLRQAITALVNDEHA